MQSETKNALKVGKSSRCSECRKPAALCLCDWVTPVDCKTHVFVFQHPAERDQELGSAQLIRLALKNSSIKVGLSISNMKKATGLEAVELSEWAVLYLGSKKEMTELKLIGQEYVILDRKGNALPEQEPNLKKLKGLVVLDGSWREVKALWWRNPWLLKLKRLVVISKQRSLYANLRREPRAESLSSIESVALALRLIEGNQELEKKLIGDFTQFLANYNSYNRSV